MSVLELTKKLSTGAVYQPAVLNELATELHSYHREAGWWNSINTGQFYKRPWPMLRILIVTELAEAIEGTRKNLMDDKLKHRFMPEVEMADAAIRILDAMGGYGLHFATFARWRYEDYIKTFANKDDFIVQDLLDGIIAALYHSSSMAPNLNVAVWRIVCFCRYMNYDLWGAVAEKHEYNMKRADHKVENRKKTGGKVW